MNTTCINSNMGRRGRRQRTKPKMKSRLNRVAKPHPISEIHKNRDEELLVDRNPSSQNISSRTELCHDAQPPVNQSSSSSVHQSFCRICYGGVEEGPLILPCSCRGTMAFVHLSCLSKWHSIKGTINCEICKAPYKGMLKMHWWMRLMKFIQLMLLDIMILLTQILVHVVLLPIGLVVITNEVVEDYKLSNEVMTLTNMILPLIYISCLCSYCCFYWIFLHIVKKLYTVYQQYL